MVVKTINGNVLTLVSASGFIPGLIGAVSSSSTAANIIGFDPQPVAFPTTTQGPTTTSTSTSTSTTTAAPATAFIIYSGSYSGTPGTATITGAGSVYYNSNGPGYPGPTSLTLYVPAGTAWGPAGAAQVQAYTDSALTTLYTGGAENDFTAWEGNIGTTTLTGGDAVRFFDKTLDAFVSPQF